MSRDYRGSRVAIYPAYFDANLSRKEGRRVPLNLAVPSPSIEDIVEVCNKLNLNPEIEPEKAYPRNFTLKGRVIVDKRGSKVKTLLLIAGELKKYYSRKRGS
mgnify:CR=1 FL=1